MGCQAALHGHRLWKGSNMSRVRSVKVALVLGLMVLPILLSLSGCYWGRGGGDHHDDHHDGDRHDEGHGDR